MNSFSHGPWYACMMLGKPDFRSPGAQVGCTEAEWHILSQETYKVKPPQSQLCCTPVSLLHKHHMSVWLQHMLHAWKDAENAECATQQMAYPRGIQCLTSFLFWVAMPSPAQSLCWLYCACTAEAEQAHHGRCPPQIHIVPCLLHCHQQPYLAGHRTCAGDVVHSPPP